MSALQQHIDDLTQVRHASPCLMPSLDLRVMQQGPRRLMRPAVLARRASVSKQPEVMSGGGLLLLTAPRSLLLLTATAH